jgi:hypothetical protein
VDALGWMAFVATLAASSAGCGLHYEPSPRMVDAAATEVTPVPEAATLVFARPSVFGGVLNPSLFIDGKYVGDIEATRRLVVTVPAGAHTIVAGMPDLKDFCRRLEATVDPNKIYFVKTTMVFGAELFALKPSDAAEIKTWAAEAGIARGVDPSGLAAHPIDAKGQAECEQEAAERFAKQDADEKAKHIVRAADGFSAVP